jgi:hypothetical protein
MMGLWSIIIVRVIISVDDHFIDILVLVIHVMLIIHITLLHMAPLFRDSRQ